MKKYLLLLAAVIVMVGFCRAQPATDKVVKMTPAELRDAMSPNGTTAWGLAGCSNHVCIMMKNHYIDSSGKKPAVGDVISFNGNEQLARLNGVKEIELGAEITNDQYYSRFLYRVVANDSIELVHWTRIATRKLGKGEYAFLGRFNVQHQIIKLELYDPNDYKDRVVISFNGGYMPKPQARYVGLNYNNKYLFQPDKQEYIPNSKAHYFLKKDWEKKPISFRWSDSINHLSIQIVSTPQNSMYHVYLKRKIEGKTDSVMITNNWQSTYYSPFPLALINASFFNKPGDYEIIVKPEMPEGFKVNSNALAERIPFTVLPGPTSIPLSRVIFIISVILGTGVYCFGIYRTNMRRHLKQKEKDKQIAALQLASVRSQLNPHFIFNALAGIQNLMNRNETENANKYLSRFARITRSILDDGQKELTTIEQEINLLRNYLEMEQMRFAFNFEIKVDENNVDQQIQIPAMLLQPFIENAVKHGVSSLKNEGLITVTFENKNGVLILSVQDNGKGFIPGNATGMGIKLCSERITLLNGTYKNSNITLHQKSDNSGTLIRIELRDWV